MARTRSADLSITIIAAVPRPDLRATRLSKSISAVSASSAGIIRTGRTARDDGGCPSRRTPPKWSSISWRSGDRHGFLDHAGFVDVARRAHQLGAGVIRAAEGGEPGRAAAQNFRRHRDRSDVVHRCRIAIQHARSGRNGGFRRAGRSCLRAIPAGPFRRRRCRRRRRE